MRKCEFEKENCTASGGQSDRQAAEGPKAAGNYVLGRAAEEQAAAYLEQHGFRILARNYRFHRNEIDIIAKEGAALCFVEVKARSSRRYGYACEAVTAAKQQAIRKTAQAYLMAQKLSLTQTVCRFDVLCVQDGSITLMRNAF